MCQQCSEGVILSNGFCDICGFNELRFVEEYESWLDSLDAPAFIEEWEQWCDVIHANEVKEAA